MKFIRLAATVSFTLTCATSLAGEAVTVLGVPLGGKSVAPIPKCKSRPASKYVEQGVCWNYILGTFAGTKDGSLKLPKRDTLPAWAALGEVSASVRKDGVITQLTVKNQRSADAPAIIDSISTRFGPPGSFNPDPPYRWYASWDRPEIGISLLCKLSTGCYIRFESAETHAAEKRRIRERMEVDRKRSVSP